MLCDCAQGVLGKIQATARNAPNLFFFNISGRGGD